MHVEQAVFTSAQTSRGSGYHLVARSPGVDERLAQQLSLWAPSEKGLIDRSLHAESLNAFPVGEDWLAVSRTVYAGAEYSGRGQFRLETNMLALRREQLVGYDSNPLMLARAAFALGQLRLRSPLPATLTAVSLPSAMPAAPAPPPTAGNENRLLDEILHRHTQQRLVVVGSSNPHGLLERLLHRLPVDRRLDVSFSTGLKPSIHRPFCIQFLPDVNDALVRELEARGMTCLSA